MEGPFSIFEVLKRHEGTKKSFYLCLETDDGRLIHEVAIPDWLAEIKGLINGQRTTDNKPGNQGVRL